ncbi:serine protease [Bacteriovorax sp. DB6_IX]|uniref:trypsin-like serine peptidase n=1 Tax=Bacteriovorax sp. DB6_IX TaxID=1353530 RepID=UPI0009DBCFEC|nr:serine protease [Bacteriovorax sp. DB6_IX]
MRIFLSAFFILTLASCEMDRPVNKVSSAASCLAPQAIIYGDNNISKVEELENRDLTELAKSVAAVVSSHRVMDVDHQRDHLLFRGETLASAYRMCDDSLNSQRAGIRCTSFLVGKDLLLTAGHCLVDPQLGSTKEEVCENSEYIFDLNDSAFQGESSVIARIEREKAYKCQSIVDYKLDDDGDYALIKLNREVSDREPLKLLNIQDLKYGNAISTIGFPLGLTLRASTDGQFFELSNDKRWLLNQVDTFFGSSGGPIIDEATKMVVGIHTHGLKGSLVLDKENACYRFSEACQNPRDCGASKAFNISLIEELQNKVIEQSQVQRQESGCE